MIRALKLEWLKLRNYRAFWVLTVLYLLALFIIASIGVFFLEWLKYIGADFDGIDPTIIPIYDFPDIWQNITYLATFVKILLAFIIIISVSNDISFNTMRQNIIDGVSKREFILSKLLLIITLAAVSTLFLFLVGFINGSIYSHVWGPEFIFDEFEFLLTYFYEVIIYCTFAMLLTLIINKVGFVIVLLTLYTFFFEPVAAAIMMYNDYFKDGIVAEIAQFLPIRSINNLITVPYAKYVFVEIEDNVSYSALAIATSWFIIYLSSIFYILNKRDLK